MVRSSLVWSLPLGKRESCTRICSNCTKDNVVSCESRSPQDGWDTDEHLPVVDGIGILENVNESRDGRVFHVKEETGVAILELLDGLCLFVLGLALEERIRTRIETRSEVGSRTLRNLDNNLDMVEGEGRDGVDSPG